MVSEKLKSNSRRNLILTLRCLGDVREIRRYEATVPFVQVPTELAAQWEQHSSLLHQQQWFRELFTAEEYVSLMAFDQELQTFLNQFGAYLPEVNELIDHPDWKKISEHASSVCSMLH